ncbi:MAG TPA: NAD(P)/FAD-dependent oxidoreductase [Rhizomicrobium sp.]|nr:NAD(P)/FAD-dependent oxidoreductase [Rhizomicrobium sp.]
MAVAACAEGAVVVVYDACVIGAGADGLSAAIWLARAGLTVRVIEPGNGPGRCLATREFHPGFFTSPYQDSFAPVPPAMVWALGFAKGGALMIPDRVSTALWPGANHIIAHDDGSAASGLLSRMAGLASDAAARALKEGASQSPRAGWFAKPAIAPPWPGEALCSLALNEMTGDLPAHAAAHICALALMGRAGDPFLTGSALHLLAPGAGGSGIVIGGQKTLADILAATACETGVQISYGLDVTDITHKKDRVTGIVLADGTQIAARAVVSTLDVKRSILSLFSWNTLPKDVVASAGAFRMGGGTARVLLALDAPPDMAYLDPAMARGLIHIAPSFETQAAANAACRAGIIAEHLPVSVRLASAVDPSAAPPGKAVITASLGCVPFHLFDGTWTRDKRDILRDRALTAIENVLPGTKDRVLGAEVIAPPDIEEALGATSGDLWGGEIAADQMFESRPYNVSLMTRTRRAPRIALDGFYLAGSSTIAGPLASCVSGVAAAQAVLADRKAGRGQ